MGAVKKSFFWSAIEQMGPKAVQLLISVALMRLLDPSMFGLMGMLAIFIPIAQVFSDCGLSASLIQRKTITPDDETTVCVMNIGSGLALALLFCAISPLVAKFYDQPMLMPMLWVQAVSVVVSSLCIVQSALLVRTMQFHKTALVNSVSTVATGVVGIGMAYFGCGVWSLVVSVLVGNVVRLVMYWTLSSWRPHGKVRWSCIKDMWGFSSYLLYCNIIGIVFQNMYQVVIGKVYSPASLGHYNRANDLRLQPISTLSEIVNRVAFPLFSRCHDDKPQLLRRMREIVRISTLAAACGMVLLTVIADPLIPLLFSEKWRPAIPLLEILSLASILYPVSALLLVSLRAQGHSHLNFRLESIKMVVGILAVVFVYRYGVAALAWSLAVMSVGFYFLNAYYNVKLLDYHWGQQAFDILPCIALSAAAGSLAWWVGGLADFSPVITLGLRGGLFVLLCLAAVVSLRKTYFVDIWRHLTWAFGRLRFKPVLAL